MGECIIFNEFVWGNLIFFFQQDMKCEMKHLFLQELLRRRNFDVCPMLLVLIMQQLQQTNRLKNMFQKVELLLKMMKTTEIKMSIVNNWIIIKWFESATN